MKKFDKNKLFKILIPVVCLSIIFVTASFFRAFSCAHQAKFNVDILERFIRLYRLEHKEFPPSLSDLRPIDVVSFGESLALNSKDLASGEWRGYRYAYQRLDKEKFVLSASPVGFLPAEIEFGITEQGFLRLNTLEVDPDHDSRVEMEEWKRLRRSEGVVTRPR